MKPRIVSTPAKWLVALGIVLCGVDGRTQEATVLKTDKDKTSYGIGVDMARNFKRQGIEINLDLLVRGFRESEAGAKLLLTEPELDELRKIYMAEAIRKQALAKRTPGQENAEKGEAFLAKNKARKGVICLPSGLQYEVLKTGSGKKPVEADTVECHYRGIRLDGAEFFSTATNKPATFKVNQAMVSGWSQVLPLMPVGSKWKLFVPPELGFGARGVGQTVGPNETIIFELELAGIK